MTNRSTGPACGNNSNYRMSEGDRQAVADFRAYLAARAALARIRQMADAWEQRLPEVIRTPAVVSALRAVLDDAAPAVVEPPADQTALRDRIAAAVEQLHETGAVYALGAGEAGRIADAVLAVLPSAADWDALVREADRLRRDGTALHARAEKLDKQLAALQRQVPEPADRPAAPDRRARYRAAIHEADGWVCDDGQHMVDAVMAVADAEQQKLHAELVSERDASRRLLAQRQEMAEERYAWQQRGDRAEAALRRMAVETATTETQADVRQDEEA